MPKYSKCVVESCDHCQQRHTDCIYAKFPKDIERCRAWLKVVGVSDLVHLPPEKLNTIRYVCGCHFTDDQFSNATRKRLKMTAIPSLFDDSVKPLDDDLLSEFPLPRDFPRQLTEVPPTQAVLKATIQSLRRLLPKTPATLVSCRTEKLAEELLEVDSAQKPGTSSHVVLCSSNATEVSEDVLHGTISP